MTRIIAWIYVPSQCHIVIKTDSSKSKNCRGQTCYFDGAQVEFINNLHCFNPRHPKEKEKEKESKKHHAILVSVILVDLVQICWIIFSQFMLLHLIKAAAI
ncbi:hypothetical protein Nepgr_018172 [Nepenthes gracilis]|uniref:Uncharacterized protein n=1 Tax=Nepenthes gracilis TaxID=150966 RepID=A0AAD3ST79_NEPGR|nr:hypothetical protein Nepgr_018172 [Nepenthes gracilis]